jgi:lipopolysaccharide/colanic/teichoic acid biosynthesis glycosyltransferase
MGNAPTAITGVLREQSSAPSTWCNSVGKRLFDIACAFLLLLLASPLMLVAGLMVAATSRGPVLFRQERVGQGGKKFTLLKFRTMVHDRQEHGPSLTRQGDSRVTAVGRVLRQTKLDELPQLLNVIRGDMSLVGPRPDVAEYIQQLPEGLRQILALRPGITGASASINWDEEEVLSRIPAEQLNDYYMGTLLPWKIGIDLEYARDANFASDVGILVRTLEGVFRHGVVVR